MPGTVGESGFDVRGRLISAGRIFVAGPASSAKTKKRQANTRPAPAAAIQAGKGFILPLTGTMVCGLERTKCRTRKTIENSKTFTLFNYQRERNDNHV